MQALHGQLRGAADSPLHIVAFQVDFTPFASPHLYRSHLLDVLRFASGNPTPQLISRLLRMKKHGHDDTRQIDIQRFSMMGQSPEQIRARARATILHSPHPTSATSLRPAPPLPKELAEKVERKKLQSTLSVIHEDDSDEDEEDEDEEEDEEVEFSGNAPPRLMDKSNIPTVTLKHINDMGSEVDDAQTLKPLRIPERKRSQRSSTSTARAGLLKRIVEEWIQSVPWRVSVSVWLLFYNAVDTLFHFQ